MHHRLDKMNVLYIGVDNPVTIAASGGGDDKSRPASWRGCSLTGSAVVSILPV